ncbi:MAG: uL14 family ribosomal protein [Nanoarchaeota archaeon]|nr:uL14 family ribosomal protein [Nanoarchaeota archaeon]
MKAVKANVTRGLDIGAKMTAADNSGAKIVELVSVKLGKAVKKRRQSAGIGDVVTVSVKTGVQSMRKKIANAVIIRQKMPYMRSDGTRIKFEDNACVILKSLEGDPKGSVIKGAVAREVVDRFPKIGKISSIVV